MAKKKLQLEDLKVNSFITNLDAKKSNQVKGGRRPDGSFGVFTSGGGNDDDDDKDSFFTVTEIRLNNPSGMDF